MGLGFLISEQERMGVGVCQEIVLDRETILVGREDEADLRLPDLEVAKRHLLIRRDKEGCVVEELGSSSGTRLNGSPIPTQQEIPLQPGDKLRIGSFEVVFLGPKAMPLVENTKMIAQSLMHDWKCRQENDSSNSFLRIENGPGTGNRFMLSPNATMRLGRGEGCDLVLMDARVSRVHAEVHFQDGAAWLYDAGSHNGSFVDGQRVSKTKAAPLRDRSLIQLGGIRLILEQPPQVPSAPDRSKGGVLRSGLASSFLPLLILATSLLALAAVWWL